MKIMRIVALLLLTLGLLATTGCTSATKIGDILADSSQFTGKEITIKGTVGETSWFSVAGKGAYQLGDGTGTIWVITTQPPPQEGESITTKGNVQAAFTLLGTSYGTILNETTRK